MNISRTDRETSVFVLKWADIEKLHGSISALLPKIAISASCNDRLDRSFSNIEELKKFSNSQRAAITELRFVALDEKLFQRFSISLSNDKRNNVRISLDASESIAIQLNDLYQDFLDSVRPWYSWIARTDWYLVVFGMWMLVLLGVVAIAMFNASAVSFEWPKDVAPMKVFLKGILIGVLPFLIGVTMSFVRNKFYPTGIFAFGDGENRHNASEVIRTVLIAAFVVSIVASLVVSWF